MINFMEIKYKHESLWEQAVQILCSQYTDIGSLSFKSHLFMQYLYELCISSTSKLNKMFITFFIKSEFNY